MITPRICLTYGCTWLILITDSCFQLITWSRELLSWERMSIDNNRQSCELVGIILKTEGACDECIPQDVQSMMEPV